MIKQESEMSQMEWLDYQIENWGTAYQTAEKRKIVMKYLFGKIEEMSEELEEFKEFKKNIEELKMEVNK